MGKAESQEVSQAVTWQLRVLSQTLGQCIIKVWPHTSGMDTTWELIKTYSLSPPPTPNLLDQTL